MKRIIALLCLAFILTTFSGTAVATGGCGGGCQQECGDCKKGGCKQ